MAFWGMVTRRVRQAQRRRARQKKGRLERLLDRAYGRRRRR